MFNSNYTKMKLKQVKMKLSGMSLTEAEMKNVIGGVQAESERSCSVGSVCYVGHYQGSYAWSTPTYDSDPTCYCSYSV